MTPLTLSLDIGGSHVTAGLIDAQARHVLRTARREVPHEAPLTTLLGAWADAAREAAQAHAPDVRHLGLAVPGPFDPLGGQSHMTHKFPALHGVPLRPLLREVLGPDFSPALPILFGNDADLFALGEWWASPTRPDRLIGVTLGTGLGSGFILRGQAQQSGPGVPPGGELWNAPDGSGLLEDTLSGPAITRLGEALTGRQGSAADWAQAARKGSGAAQRLWAEFGTRAAQRLAPWADAFGAEELVLGGNVSQAFDLFAPTLHLGTCRVRRSAYFELAPLLGAAALHATPLETHP
ncbi:ROK family protein [Deinococcus radiotolerans]|uniref:Glucokinase n=1 Tax=Deinococcus radiotolerans TaxID=1309407 RepID=A0ABQ2FJV0_9DEIO|nr:ROK family protein [Deinococcus radiotolerans]GGK99439.1 glucokinase [Deinococcus radiotolerans]